MLGEDGISAGPLHCDVWTGPAIEQPRYDLREASKRLVAKSRIDGHRESQIALRADCDSEGEKRGPRYLHSRPDVDWAPGAG